MSLNPAKLNTGNKPLQAENLKVWNCTNCRRRKVRCDRRYPCAPCVKNKSECVFPISGRIPRRGRDAHARLQKQAELVGRLRRLEAMVGDLGSQVECAAAMDEDRDGEQSMVSSTVVSGVGGATSGETSWGDHQVGLHPQSADESQHTTHHEMQDTPDRRESVEELQALDEDGDLIEANDGGLIVKDRFWTVFCKEVEQIFEAVHGPEDMHFHESNGSPATSASTDRQHNGYYNFLLRHTSAVQQQESLYPLPSQMLFLWQTYVDNVDAFMKILHVPSVTKVIRELRGSYDSLDPSMRALVLAIALAAIMSLEDAEVQANFNMSRVQLLTRYRLGTERALEQADFLNCPNITVLQALVIYLGVLQHTGESRPAWLLVGVLIRIAISMETHRDGSHFDNLTFFDVEMRRRLWWQICFLDSRSVDREVSAFKISEDMFDTHFPTNTNDADLSPEMAISPSICDDARWTDMTVSLIHCEIWRLSHRLQSLTRTNTLSPHNHIDALLNIFHQTSTAIESNHLSHLNSEFPLHAFTATTTRLSLTKISLILHSKHRSSPASTPNPAPSPLPSSSTLSQSLSLLHLSTHLQLHTLFHPYRWSLHHNSTPPPSQGYQHQALHTVLTHLLASSSSSSPNNTWSSTHEQAYSTAHAAAAAAGLFPLARTSDANRKAQEEEILKQDPRYRSVRELLAQVEQRRRRYHHQHGAVVEGSDGQTSTTTTMTANNVDPSPTLRLPVLSSPIVDTAGGTSTGEELFLPLSLSYPTPAPALALEDIHSVNNNVSVNHDDDSGNPFSDDAFVPRLDRGMEWQTWGDEVMRGGEEGGGREWDSDLNLGMWDWDWDLNLGGL